MAFHSGFKIFFCSKSRDNGLKSLKAIWSTSLIDPDPELGLQLFQVIIEFLKGAGITPDYRKG
jgi:hypothetical protein